jgi:hypothetical protein
MCAQEDGDEAEQIWAYNAPALAWDELRLIAPRGGN